MGMFKSLKRMIKNELKGLMGMETSQQKHMRKQAEQAREEMQNETRRIQAQQTLKAEGNLDNIANVSAGGGDEMEIFLGSKKKKPETTSSTLGLGGL